MTPEMWAILAGLAAPLFTALATKLGARRPLKALVNIVAAIVLGTLATMVADADADLLEAAKGSLWAVLAAWSSYTAGWKPLGTTAAIQRRTARVGLR